jgi:hypothetical protein
MMAMCNSPSFISRGGCLFETYPITYRTHFDVLPRANERTDRYSIYGHVDGTLQLWMNGGITGLQEVIGLQDFVINDSRSICGTAFHYFENSNKACACKTRLNAQTPCRKARSNLWASDPANCYQSRPFLCRLVQIEQYNGRCANRLAPAGCCRFGRLVVWRCVKNIR